MQQIGLIIGVLIFTKKRIKDEKRLTLYNEIIEKMKELKYLGLWLDEKYTWRKHIETKCKKNCKSNEMVSDISHNIQETS